MKINELTGYKSNQLYKDTKNIFSNINSFKDRLDKQTQFEQYMMDNGFTFLGTGAYGSEFIHPTYPWVFKIFHNDPAFLAYFKYARQNQNNPNIPKVNKNIIKINKNTFAIRMEKLEKITKSDKDIQILISYIRPIFQNTDLSPEDINFLQQYYPNILKIINDMKAISPNSTLDLHANNIMKRSDNTPVIIDPIIQDTEY